MRCQYTLPAFSFPFRALFTTFAFGAGSVRFEGPRNFVVDKLPYILVDLTHTCNRFDRRLLIRLPLV